jgi:hypothetical protein
MVRWSSITCEGVFNSHTWAQHNPHVTRQWGHQVCWSINVWASIIGNCVVGPYLLPNRLNGPAYCVFLQEVLPVLLEDTPLAVRDMQFQHNGAPAHFSADPTAPQQFPDRWIGCGGPVSWPVRSLDLNPLDFFLWGTPERNCLQGSADWHRRLDSKVSCCCGNHWCRHVATCASWYSTACGCMLANARWTLWTLAVTTILLVTYLLCSVSASVIQFSSVVYPDMWTVYSSYVHYFLY